MTKLSGPMLPPRSGAKPRQLVVLLHGYGSDGSDLIALATHWQDLLPDALFVSPNAPHASRENPLGFQWFALDIERPVSRLTNLPGAAPAVVGFLQALWTQTGLGAGQTILAGFSQGAMMALHVGLSLKDPPMGIIAFSGALVPPEGLATRTGPKPPVCLVHGALDAVVEAHYSAEASDSLRKLGYSVSHHVSPQIGHSIAPDGLGFASAFIAGLVARH